MNNFLSDQIRLILSKHRQEHRRLLALGLTILLVVGMTALSLSSPAMTASTGSAGAQDGLLQTGEALGEDPEAGGISGNALESVSENVPESVSENEAFSEKESAEPEDGEEAEAATESGEAGEAAFSKENEMGEEKQMARMPRRANGHIEYITTLTENEMVALAIYGAQRTESGGYRVSAGIPYKLQITFEEPSDEHQFSMTQDLTYQLPAAFTPKEAVVGKKGTVVINQDSSKTVQFTYDISTSGEVRLHWPRSDEDEDWEELISSQYLRLNLEVEGSFSENVKEEVFFAKSEGTVQIDNEHAIRAIKRGTYNAKTNRIDYTVTIGSLGTHKNVVVTDEVIGTALKFLPETVKIAPANHRGSIATNAKGFTYRIAEMKHNESIIISYSADINLTIPKDQITKVEQTGNKIRVESDDEPPKEDIITGEDFEHKISYSDIEKRAGELTDGASPDVKKLQWTILANQAANVSMADKTITDRIQTPESMKYAGEGITVERYDKNGALVKKETIAWSDLQTHKADTWVYRLPENEGKYSYKITYETEVQAKYLSEVTVKNEVTNDYDGSKDGDGKNVGELLKDAFEKKGIRVDYKKNEIEWKIKAKVPKEGYNQQFEIWDLYASIFDHHSEVLNRDVRAYDAYVPGSIVVEGLVAGERYELDESQEDKLGIIFYNNGKPGAAAADRERTIVVKLRTKISDKRLEDIKKGQNEWVNNQAQFIVNGESKTAGGSIRVRRDSRLKKSHIPSGNPYIVNNVTLPAYQYRIRIEDMSDESFTNGEPIVLTDRFDPTYFTFIAHHSAEWDNKTNGYLYAGTGPYDWDNSTISSHKPPEGRVVSLGDEEGTLNITIRKEDVPKDANGNYYQYYFVIYYLGVKDEAALLALNKAAAEQEGYHFKNTVENDDFGDSEDDLTYETEIITKEASAAAKNENTGDYEVDYTITINPYGAKIGNEPTLSATDSSQNISINLDSIYATGLDGVTRDNSLEWRRNEEGKLVFTIPNEHAIQIHYKARIVGTGTVHYKNEVELRGHTKSTEGDQTFSSDVSGSAEIYEIRLRKNKANEVRTMLSGVHFDLYKYENGSEGRQDTRRPAEDDPHWEKISQTPFVTGADGAEAGCININRATLAIHDPDHNDDAGVHQGVDKNTWYKVVEVANTSEASVSVVDGVKYSLGKARYFYIDVASQVDYANDIYPNHDQIQIENTPVEEKFELPETGGFGTSVLYIVGAILAIGAGAALIVKKRMQR